MESGKINTWSTRRCFKTRKNILPFSARIAKWMKIWFMCKICRRFSSLQSNSICFNSFIEFSCFHQTDDWATNLNQILRLRFRFIGVQVLLFSIRCYQNLKNKSAIGTNPKLSSLSHPAWTQVTTSEANESCPLKAIRKLMREAAEKLYWAVRGRKILIE